MFILITSFYWKTLTLDDCQPGPSAQGAIVAAMPAGSLLGALAVTQLADRVGRKKTIILAGIVWVIGSILQCASVVRVGINLYYH